MGLLKCLYRQEGWGPVHKQVDSADKSRGRVTTPRLPICCTHTRGFRGDVTGVGKYRCWLTNSATTAIDANATASYLNPKSLAFAMGDRGELHKITQN